MKYSVRYYSLEGTFKTLQTITFDTLVEAKQSAMQFAHDYSFTNVKFVDDDDYIIRVTATTPNGRAGRNIAAIEPDGDFS